MHTHTRVMAAASAVAVVSSLVTGCDYRDWSGQVSVQHHAPNAAPSRTAQPARSPAPAKPTQTPSASKRAHASPTAKRESRTNGTSAPPHSTVEPTAVHTPASSSPLGTVAERKVVALVNAARAEAGCQALRIDRRLRKAAYLHSRDMGRHHYFSHNSRDGGTPWDRIRAAGYTHPAAENIAAGQATPTSVMDAWMHSQGHRDNILNCSYKAIGVGLWKGGGTPVWTQDFGFA